MGYERQPDLHADDVEIPDFPNIGRDSNEAVLEWTNALSPTEQDRITFGTLYNHIDGQEMYFGLGFPLHLGGRAIRGAFYGQLDHRFRRFSK